jgi:hypothetical protein
MTDDYSGFTQIVSHIVLFIVLHGSLFRRRFPKRSLRGPMVTPRAKTRIYYYPKRKVLP